MVTRTSGIIIGIALFSFVTFSSCGGMFSKGASDSASIKAALDKALAENANEVTIADGNYVMSIPKHLALASTLNDQASLQYQDLAKELYIIVINESKTDFIKTYSDPDLDPDLLKYDDNLTPEKNYRLVQMQSLKKSMTLKSEPTIKKTTINGLDAEVVDFTGSVEGIEYDIYYKLAFIEGTKDTYMVMTWTLDSDKNTNMDEMDGMINSFKLKK